MNFKRFLYTDVGRNIISVLLGIGLASLFQKVCKDKSCLVFTGPIISDIDGKIFKHDDKCFQYDISSVKCDDSKRIIETTKLQPTPPPPPSISDNLQSLKNIWW
jgi:hypothetical protein